MKLERIILLGLLLLSSWFAVAQDRSIAFENVSFQEALEKAKQSNKLLFVDCYTSWCGPCKMLARDVFTNNEVADYFNAHFVSLKVDCEKGEGPQLRERFGVSSYPTLLFIDGSGKVVNKILGASQAPAFLKKVKEGLDPKNSLSAKEAAYEGGNRDRAFVLDLIKSYKGQREYRKAQTVSVELLSGLSEQEMLSAEMWDVVRDYYVSPYGSPWWNFIIGHSDEYAGIVGKEAVAKKIGETLHPYLFGLSCGHVRLEHRQDLKNIKMLIDEHQPAQKEALYAFIEMGESACFDDFNGYFKTVMKVVPKMDAGEHFRFFHNALDNLLKSANAKQKQQLLVLLKESQKQQSDYFKPEFQKFIDKVEKVE